MLGDDDFAAACVEIGDDGIGVEGRVGDESLERDAVEQGRNADRIEALSRQKTKHEVAQGIGKGEDFGRHAAF